MDNNRRKVNGHNASRQTLDPVCRRGAGWALLGYCPGTALYAEVYPFFKATVLTWGDFGPLTLPELMGRHHWVLIPWFCVLGALLLRWLHKRGL